MNKLLWEAYVATGGSDINDAQHCRDIFCGDCAAYQPSGCRNKKEYTCMMEQYIAEVWGLA